MKAILFSLFILFLYVHVSQTQWSADARLTNNDSVSGLSNNNGWGIASSGNIVSALWQDQRDGNLEVYYKRSTNSGASWGADIRFTNNSAISTYSCISASGSLVHAIWTDGRDGGAGEIYYKRSSDGGATWAADVRITNAPGSSVYPSVNSLGSNVYAVWQDERDGNWEVYFKISTDGGITWGTDTRLSNNASLSYIPSVSAAGQNINVVWYENRDGNFEIYYKGSSNGGINWSAETRLTNNASASNNPSISTSGSEVHVTWYDLRDGNEEIYYKRSSDSGVSWGADTRLTNNIAHSSDPSVTSSGSNVHVVWREDRDGGYEIYYKTSTNGGIAWGADTRITNSVGLSYNPSVSVSNSAVHIVWQDIRDGNWEIYYNNNPTGNPVGIVNINTGIPENFRLFQNYPNPFNPATKIKFAVPNFSNVKITIFDILGRLTDELINEQLNAGTYEIDFNASGYSSGVYYYKIEAGSYAETMKMILIK